MNVKRIAIGCDHAGFPLKSVVVETLENKGIEVIDYGTDSTESVDYPDFVHPVADVVVSGQVDMGILICGSGNGVAMTANKHQGIRAAIAWSGDLAELARKHNDANILALPARFISEDHASELVRIFVETEFEGGRHSRRVNKINC